MKGNFLSGRPAAGWNHTNLLEVIGDYYCVLEDRGTAPPLFSPRRKDDGTADFNDLGIQRYRPGLMREYINIAALAANNFQPFDIYNVENGASYKYIMTGATLPINATLWAGATDGILHKDKWQSNGDGEVFFDHDKNGNSVLRDATNSVKVVAHAACAKLRENWGPDNTNLRIYLIKYRKQTQYKHPVTGNPVDFDYSYLDSCASGTSAPYMYDITETDPTAAKTKLNEALAAIAADIKKWAKYKEAENVD